MQDPVMQSILQQAQTDPAALQEHMKNPAIRSNIQKLIVRSPSSTLWEYTNTHMKQASGVIRVGRWKRGSKWEMDTFNLGVLCSGCQVDGMNEKAKKKSQIQMKK